MLLSNTEKLSYLENVVKNKFFKDKKFISNNLKEIDSNLVVKKYFNGQLSYGNSNDCFGDYLIFTDKNNEGFLYMKNSFLENGSYQRYKKIILTKDFIDINNIFLTYFNIDNLREEYIKYMYVDILNNYDLSFERILSSLYFYSDRSIYKKNTQIKFLGLFILNIYFYKENGLSCINNESIKDNLYYSINTYKTYYKKDISSIENHTFLLNINKIILNFILIHMDYLLKKNISFIKLISDIKRVYEV
jgi:hypothetical protein